jgi:acyl-CoA reductase-like NAD-dependent aldehyde dehydrogenase
MAAEKIADQIKGRLIANQITLQITQKFNHQMRNPISTTRKGVWRDAESSRTFDDPGAFSGKIYKGGSSQQKDMNLALTAATQAILPGQLLCRHKEQNYYLRQRHHYKRRRSEIAEILAKETGSTISFATFQQDLLAQFLEEGAAWAYHIKGEVLQTNVPGLFSMGVRRPLGVVASFTPWNGASILSWRTVVSPIIAGNTVVVKPSEFAPISAGLMIAEIAEAGFPPGVINAGDPCTWRRSPDV